MLIYRLYSITLYKIKTLLRSKIFKYYSLCLLIIIIFNFVALHGHWSQRGISSLIPYRIFISMNIYQAICCIFISSHFFTEDKSDSFNSLYVRSYANIEYFLGKFFGIVISLCGIHVIIAGISIFFNLCFLDVPVNVAAFLYYPILILLPIIIFVCGLTFLSNVLIPTKILCINFLVIIVLLLYMSWDSAYYGVFDVFSKNLPLLNSDYIGFGNIKEIVLHRAIFITAGIGLFFISSLFYYRLKQSVKSNIISCIIGSFCILLSIFFALNYVSNIQNDIKFRADIREINKKYSNHSTITISKCSIDLEHQNNEINCKASIKLKNLHDTDISEYLFSLNPGLEVEKIVCGNTDLRFIREEHIIKINPLSLLHTGSIDSLAVYYHGTVNGNVCYLNIDETTRNRKYKKYKFCIDKRYGIITPRYVLLTEENLWYPIAGINNKFSGKGFIDFELNVTTNDDLIAISQGKHYVNKNGSFCFNPQNPLPKISLIIGDYSRKSITVDDVEFAFYVKPGNEY